MLGRPLTLAIKRSLSSKPPAPRHAVITGSLGVGNLGDDALLAAFLARHGARYAGITVLTHRNTAELPGKDLLLPAERAALPDRIAVMRSPKLDMRGLHRGLGERLAIQVSILTGAAAGLIDYIWLGGLLGRRGHMLSRVRELDWALGFVDRFVYYFGDAEFKPQDRDVAARIMQRLRSKPSYVALRSGEGAELLRSVAPGSEVHVGTDIVLERYVSKGLLQRAPNAQRRLVINPSGVHEPGTVSWLACASEAARRGWAVDWVSFSDWDDLKLCDELAARATAAYGGEHRVVPVRSAIECLRGAHLCVASRFHCHILSLCMALPVLSVPLGTKSARLMRDLGLERWQLAPASQPGAELVAPFFDDFERGAYPAAFTERLSKLALDHAPVAEQFDASLSY